MDSIEETLMAEGLHPLDVAWLEESIRTLEAALRVEQTKKREGD